MIQPKVDNTNEVDQIDEIYKTTPPTADQLLINGKVFVFSGSSVKDRYNKSVRCHKRINYQHLLKNGFFERNKNAIILRFYQEFTDSEG